MIDSAAISARHRHRLRGLGCKIAATHDEWHDAFALVYESYVRSGLTQPNLIGLRVIPHHLLPTTSTLIARLGDDVIGTMTLVRDSGAGIPLEVAYGRDVDAMRDQGISFAEVSCLATRPLSLMDYPYVFMRLLRLLAQHARYVGVERLLIAAHPRHVRLYERSMGYRRFGEETSYPSVGGAPAVAAYLDFAEADRIRPRMYNECFGKPIHSEALEPREMPTESVNYFTPLTAALNLGELSGSSFSLECTAQRVLAGVYAD